MAFCLLYHQKEENDVIITSSFSFTDTGTDSLHYDSVTNSPEIVVT